MGTSTGNPPGPASGHGFVVRAATLADTPEVIRLAALMYQAMGLDASGTAWQEAASEALAARLGGDVTVLVADDPATSGRLAATGAGTIARRLPGPASPDATVGYIQWVSTDPLWRRHGLARQITAALLDWFGRHGVRQVELHATTEAEGLYRSFGFGEGANPGLRVRL